MNAFLQMITCYYTPHFEIDKLYLLWNQQHQYFTGGFPGDSTSTRNCSMLKIGQAVYESRLKGLKKPSLFTA